MKNSGEKLYHNIEIMSRILTFDEEGWKVKTLIFVG
jgi:hypothetical protein